MRVDQGRLQELYTRIADSVEQQGRKAKVGEYIKQFRDATGLSGTQFAVRLGVSDQTIVRLMTNKSTPSDAYLAEMRKMVEEATYGHIELPILPSQMGVKLWPHLLQLLSDTNVRRAWVLEPNGYHRRGLRERFESLARTVEERPIEIFTVATAGTEVANALEVWHSDRKRYADDEADMQGRFVSFQTGDGKAEPWSIDRVLPPRIIVESVGDGMEREHYVELAGRGIRQYNQTSEVIPEWARGYMWLRSDRASLEPVLHWFAPFLLALERHDENGKNKRVLLRIQD